jgi:uncharacterized protein YjbI with pentapeptide repeats
MNQFIQDLLNVVTKRMRRANLREADLSWADLSWADLSWADLRGADLRGADLRWADLRWADLRGAKNLILGNMRSDGYQFYLTNASSGWVVIAGCQRKTISEYREHVKQYNDADKEFETNLILDNLESRLAYYVKKEAM